MPGPIHEGVARAMRVLGESPRFALKTAHRKATDAAELLDHASNKMPDIGVRLHSESLRACALRTALVEAEVALAEAAGIVGAIRAEIE